MFKSWALGVAAGVALLLGAATSVQAATDLGTKSQLYYVKVKKPIFTGQYTKVNGHRGHRLLTPKGTVMRIVQRVKAKDGRASEAVLTRGLISYRLQQRVYDPHTTYKVKSFNTNYFEPYKLKLPITEYQFQAGTFTTGTSGYYRPIFNLTMDGYLQYYSRARLKHYHIQTTWLYGRKPSAGNHNPLDKIKPSMAVKLTKTAASGHHFKLYYQQPVGGLAAKKIGHGYRLSINELKDQSKTWRSNNYFYTVNWRNYQVGQRPFYFQWGSETNDPQYG